MKSIAITIISIWVIGVFFLANAGDKYSLVSIGVGDTGTRHKIALCGAPLEDGRQVGKDKLEIPLTDNEISCLQQKGIPYSIISYDLESLNRATCEKNNRKIDSLRLRAMSPMTTNSVNASAQQGDPTNMKYGSLGGYYSFNEITADLDLMRSKYPKLISVKKSIGTTSGGNPIWMVKISDNPDITENEPAGVFDACHHAREPGAMAALMYAMWYLLENYGTNQECKYLVDNRELYFIPMVNPDGYVYNQSTNPSGGGMWRKNRRNSGGGNYGVDINRNYPYQWGYDDFGSSPDPSSENYRGPSAASEPEAQSIISLINSHTIKVGATTHSYGNLYLTAYGYDEFDPEQLDVHNEYLEYVSALNEYSCGTAFLANNVANGRLQDWQLHERGIINIEPEIGSQGFWPSLEFIFPECRENLRCFLYLFWMAGARVEHNRFSLASGGNLAIGANQLVMNLQNRGQSASEPLALTFSASDPYITITDATIAVGSLSSREIRNVSMRFNLASTCPAGHTVKLTVSQNQGGFQRTASALFSLNGNYNFLSFKNNGETKTYLNGDGQLFMNQNALKQTVPQGLLFHDSNGKGFGVCADGFLQFTGSLFNEYQYEQMNNAQITTGGLIIRNANNPIMASSDIGNMLISGEKIIQTLFH